MKRFEITLLIRHPDLNPELIKAKVGLQPHRSWQAGEPRFTPKGRVFPRSHKTSCWNHVFRYQGDVHFSEEIDTILVQLTPCRALIREIDQTGGKSQLFLKLPGDQNLGDELSWKILEKFAHLKIGFSLETFPQMGAEEAA
jgi:hypothetical protein